MPTTTAVPLARSAAIAASLLARAGRDVVLVTDDWEKAEHIGLPVLRAA